MIGGNVIGDRTTLLDWSHVNNTPEHADAAVMGLAESRIRAVYAHGVPVGGEWWAYSSREHPDDIRNASWRSPRHQTMRSRRR
jgi:hypothetical protein